jgi:hypothetical protein
MERLKEKILWICLVICPPSVGDSALLLLAG